MFAPVLVLLSLLLAALPAAAQPPAEPPCAWPAGPLAATICADPELRFAAQRLAEAARRAQPLDPRPATARARAAAFRQALEAGEPGPPATPFDHATLLDLLEARIAELNEVARQGQAMQAVRGARAIPRPATLETSCLGAVLRPCRVRAAGLLVGDGTLRVLWQLQSGVTEQAGGREGIVLLAEAPGGWRAIGWAFDAARYDAPALVGSGGERLLVVRGRDGGSGTRNADLVYRQERGAWREVETESWQDALDTWLPAGLGLRQAVEYDFEDMVARSPLWREADPNCCPGAGRARFDLRIEGDRLAVAEVSLDAAARAAGLDAARCLAERATYRQGAAEARIEAAEGGLRLVLGDASFGLDAAAAPGTASLLAAPDAPPVALLLALGPDLAPGPAAPSPGAPAPRHLALVPVGAATAPLGVWSLDGCR
jgi:hypothetical protein